MKFARAPIPFHCDAPHLFTEFQASNAAAAGVLAAAAMAPAQAQTSTAASGSTQDKAHKRGVLRVAVISGQEPCFHKDLAFAVGPTPQRALVIGFSSPLLVHSYTVIARKGFAKVNTWEQINKKDAKIAEDIGSTHETLARR